MSTVVGGYEDNDASKASGLKEVTVTTSGNKAFLDVSTQNSLIPDKYDYIGVTYPTSTSEVYTFKLGGSGGTTVATVTVVYTDSTKSDLSSVTKT